MPLKYYQLGASLRTIEGVVIMGGGLSLFHVVLYRKRLVPMVLLSTIEQPEGLITRGKSGLIQARYFA